MKAVIEEFYIKHNVKILILLLFILSNIVTARVAHSRNYQMGPEAFAEEMPSEEIVVTPEPTPALDEGALAIARVLYGIRGYELSDNAKTAVIEVILNRVSDDAREFRTLDSVVAVCEQNNAFQNYEPNGQYLQSDYDLAYNKIYSSSQARVSPEGCYFLTCEYGKVIVRTEFKGGNKWEVS